MRTLAELSAACQRLQRSRQLTVEFQVHCLRELLFDAQRAFVDDPARKKAALCARRSGKTTACVIMMLLCAVQGPGRVGYFALTERHATDIVWSPQTEMGGLLKVNAALCLGGKAKDGNSLVFPNGSTVVLDGFANRHEAEKIRGNAYRLIVIDEAQDQRHSDLDYVVRELAWPALADHRGTVVLIGTPGAMPVGPFFEVTTHRRKDWSSHTWLTDQNPAMREQYAEICTTEDNTTNAFKREWLAQWVIDETLACFPGYIANARTIDSLPRLAYGDRWVDVVGGDLGFHSAMVHWKHSRGQGLCVAVDEWAVDGQTPTEMAAQVRRWEHGLGKRFDRYIIDAGGGGLQVAEEMRRHQRIPWEATNKNAMLKATCMELMDADFARGSLVLLRDERGRPRTPRLDSQLRSLAWDEATFRDMHRRELPKGCDDHVMHAAMYAWRECWHRNANPSRLPQEPDGRAYYEAMRERDPRQHACIMRVIEQAERLRKQRRAQQRSLHGPMSAALAGKHLSGTGASR